MNEYIDLGGSQSAQGTHRWVCTGDEAADAPRAEVCDGKWNGHDSPGLSTNADRQSGIDNPFGWFQASEVAIYGTAAVVRMVPPFHSLSMLTICGGDKHGRRHKAAQKGPCG